MPSFKYSARTQGGEIQTGTVEAGSQEAAIEILQQHRLIITGLLEAKEASWGRVFPQKLFERITRRDLFIFSRQLAVLFAAYVPLLEALTAIADQTPNGLFARTIRTIVLDVEGGAPLSDALERFPKVFNPFYVNMVRSGEASGKSQDVFAYLAQYLERQYDVREKIRGALLYPAFILLTFTIVIAIVMTVVLPAIGEVFAAENVELPWVTRFLLSLTGFFRNTWLVWLFMVLFGGAFIVRLLRTPHGRLWFDVQLLDVPIVGNVMRSLLLARFADNLGTLVSSGVPIIQALELSAGVVGNVVFQNAILQAREAVQRGEKLHIALKASPIVPPTVIQMLAVGEQTGKLEAILRHLSVFYQREVDRTTDNLVHIIEPLIIVGLGVGVGVFVAMVLLPIYNLSLAYG